MRRVILIGVLLAAGVLGWLTWRQHQRPPFVVSGFIEADEIRVGSRVGGRLAEVFVNEGQTVRRGQPLYRIDPFDLQAQLAEAQATLASYAAEHDRLKSGYRPQEIEQARAKRDQAAARLQQLEAGPRPAEIQIAREKVNSAAATLELAESEYQRINRLHEQNQAAPAEYDKAVRERKNAVAESAAARQELALLEEGTRKEEIAQARAALAETQGALALVESGFRKEEIARAAAQMQAAEARVAEIKTRMGELTVTAPTDCVVEAIELRPGDLVGPNAPTAAVLDLSRMWVRTYVPEARLGDVRLGEVVPIRVDSFPGQEFRARVVFIAQQAEFTPRNIQTPEERSKQVFRAKVRLMEGQDVLRVGMAADVLFDRPIEPGSATQVTTEPE
jgi:HlyD family secretion protein